MDDFAITHYLSREIAKNQSNKKVHCKTTI